LIDPDKSKREVLMNTVLEYRIRPKISRYSSGHRTTDEKKKKKEFTLFFKI